MANSNNDSRNNSNSNNNSRNNINSNNNNSNKIFNINTLENGTSSIPNSNKILYHSDEKQITRQKSADQTS